MKEQTKLIIISALFAFLIFAERTRFVPDFFSPSLLIGSIFLFLLPILLPIFFHNGSDAQKRAYSKCSNITMIYFVGLDIHVVIRAISIQYSFCEDYIVIPIYIVCEILFIKNFVCIVKEMSSNRGK